METIGKSTTTSGGEPDSSTCSKPSPALVSLPIDFQSSEQQQRCLTTNTTTTTTTTITNNSTIINIKSVEASSEVLPSEDGTTTRFAGSGVIENSFVVEAAPEALNQTEKSHNNGSAAESTQQSQGNVNSVEEKDDSVTNPTATTSNFSHVDQLQSELLNFELGEDEGDREKTPVPNFCVEGSGEGDSSVTVVSIGPLTTTITDGNSCVVVQNLTENNINHSNNSNTTNEQLDVEGDDVAGSGSGPISVQSSEDMKLSLVSWYSEPDEPPRDCCKTNLISRTTIKATPRSTTKSDCDSNIHDKSDEKENKTPMRSSTRGIVNPKPPQNVSNHTPSQRLRMHVQLFEQNSPAVENGKVTSSTGCNNSSNSSSSLNKKECPRCARRSKSGTTTPAAPSRQPRRVVQSSKSTQELKKPIKSILKSDSRCSGSRSGSGSEKQSSMDSLGSASGIACVMTRSDGGSRTKFNFNSGSFSSSSVSPEERTAAKLKRIEKYATLRLKKSKIKLDYNGEEAHECSEACKTNGTTNGAPCVNTDVMSKSMSFLEKSSNNISGGGSTLKRQGSLRIRRPSPMWEPSGTRTSALRMQKVQEAKAKVGGHKSANSSMNNSGSNHSGSGESIHTQSLHPTYNNSSYTGQHHHANSSNVNLGSCQQRSSAQQKEKHLGAKIFSKLSSAIGQTTSSAMKRLRQERGVQTDPISLTSAAAGDGRNSATISPLPTLDQSTDEVEQINHLEGLVQRYRATALRFQEELDKSEERNRELLKQVQETQSETNEMIEFLQAEKSMLGESLTEAENEGKKWQEQVDSVKKEAQSRCSSLVRLSEQHKQEALKSQALLNRLEVQSNTIVAKQSAEMSEAAVKIQKNRQRIIAVIEKLLKTYKVPPELLSPAAKGPQMGTGPDDTELNSSLLVPLISALMTGFSPVNQVTDMGESRGNSMTGNKIISNNKTPSVVATVTVDKPKASNKSNENNCSSENPPLQSGENRSTLSDSLQNLNQAILDREAAERLDDGVDSSASTTDGLDSIHDGDHLSLKTEVDKLNFAIYKLVTVIRIIVVHCDKKVSGVTSNILQCLRSIEDEKVGTIPEMINVQKSLEAWNDSTQCQTTSPTGKICFENGHHNA